MRVASTVAALGFALVLAMLPGCKSGGGGGAHSITIKGSDTMVILGQRWAEAYMDAHPDYTIQVTGGGSGTGIAALINGGTDICESSRPMKDKEKEQAKEKHGKEVKEIPVAMDGLAIYVHESCPVKDISLAQLKSIYTGKTTNWKDIGWDDAKIVVYGRENNSGTYGYFKEHVLGGADFVAEVQTLSGTAAVVNAVSEDRRSIGYGGIAYSKGIKTLSVKKDDSGPAVPPSLENVHNGTYPISRELYFYTLGEPEGDVKTFIDWVLSEEGQKVCEKVGYYPLRKK